MANGLGFEHWTTLCVCVCVCVRVCRPIQVSIITSSAAEFGKDRSRSWPKLCLVFLFLLESIQWTHTHTHPHKSQQAWQSRSFFWNRIQDHLVCIFNDVLISIWFISSHFSGVQFLNVESFSKKMADQCVCVCRCMEKPIHFHFWTWELWAFDPVWFFCRNRLQVEREKKKNRLWKCTHAHTHYTHAPNLTDLLHPDTRLASSILFHPHWTRAVVQELAEFWNYARAHTHTHTHWWKKKMPSKLLNFVSRLFHCFMVWFFDDYSVVMSCICCVFA